MQHHRAVCYIHGTIKTQCRCLGDKITITVACGDWCSERDNTKADFTRDELAIIRAGCLTANPRYPDVPMVEPWATIFDKAGKAMQAQADWATWATLHAECPAFRGCVAPDDVEPCK